MSHEPDADTPIVALIGLGILGTIGGLVLGVVALVAYLVGRWGR